MIEAKTLSNLSIKVTRAEPTNYHVIICIKLICMHKCRLRKMHVHFGVSSVKA